VSTILVLLTRVWLSGTKYHAITQSTQLEFDTALCSEACFAIATAEALAHADQQIAYDT